jgi:hypothetical protein
MRADYDHTGEIRSFTQTVSAFEATAPVNVTASQRTPEVLSTTTAGAASVLDLHRHAPGSQRVDGQLWMTASETAAAAPETPDWILEGYIARGAITELTAKPKVGKTHFMLDAVAAMFAGEQFLERATETVPVLYLTEERLPSFRGALARVGVAESEELHILYHHKVQKLSWVSICALALEKAREVNAGLVICDTLTQWAGLRADAENDAGAAIEAMKPLEMLAGEDLAVVVCRHGRKSGGELGDSARGSSAFGGAADLLLTLAHVPGQGHGLRRELRAVGRFDDFTPRLFVELQEGRYVSVGSQADIESREARRLCLEELPRDRESALTLKDLEAAATGACSRATLQRTLAKLEVEGVVEKELGAGAARSNAYGFWLQDASTAHYGEEG